MAYHTEDLIAILVFALFWIAVAVGWMRLLKLTGMIIAVVMVLGIIVSIFTNFDRFLELLGVVFFIWIIIGTMEMFSEASAYTRYDSSRTGYARSNLHLESNNIAEIDRESQEKVAPSPGENIRTELEISTRTAEAGGFVGCLLSTGRSIEVKVPAGARDGAHLRIRGCGRPGINGGTPGDALITIKIVPSAADATEDKPKRGENISSMVVVRRRTADLGGSVFVKLPDGRSFEGAIPPGTKEGAKIRYSGLGSPSFNGGEPGDALVTIAFRDENQDKAPTNQGDAQAKYELARRYEKGGVGIPKDNWEAARLFTLAAAQGHADAQCALACYYVIGDGGRPKDEREAARLFKLAAEQGNAVAQNSLALYYASGTGGLERNLPEAARLFKLAADRGVALAQLVLGAYFACGLGGLPKDVGEAMRLFKLAADQYEPETMIVARFTLSAGLYGLPKGDASILELFERSIGQLELFDRAPQITGFNWVTGMPID